MKKKRKINFGPWGQMYNARQEDFVNTMTIQYTYDADCPLTEPCSLNTPSVIRQEPQTKPDQI